MGVGTGSFEPGRSLTRRQALQLGAATGAGIALDGLVPNFVEALAAPAACGSLSDIEHVVIFIQENRSFDHYFGTYPGVLGFADHAGGSLGAFRQPVDTQYNSDGYLLPYHLSPPGHQQYCTADITHDWVPQHQSWNGGGMDRFAEVHLKESRTTGSATMGYYDRSDTPFFHALADAFTICDRYHCSVIGPTDPNRLYTFSAWIDPDGTDGGPLVETLVEKRPAAIGKFTWKTMPEVLSELGVSWKVYNSQPDATLGNNVLLYFKNFFGTNAKPELFRDAFTPSFPGTFQLDCLTGKLPQVSWILAPLVSSEHPPGPPGLGEDSVRQALSALTSNPQLWARTAVFVTYDENGGFFDHVPPPVAPLGTAGEFLKPGVHPVGGTDLKGVLGPIGLGFRVPMLVISPFSRGGFVSSEVFDHTSTLLFLERLFGGGRQVVPNLTAWRRNQVGDLTSAFNFIRRDVSVPALPATGVDAQTALQCTSSGLGEQEFPPPSPQQMPGQEAGAPRRPSGLLACAAAPAAAVNASQSSTSGLPFTEGASASAWGPAGAALTGAAFLACGALGLRLRRRREKVSNGEEV